MDFTFTDLIRNALYFGGIAAITALLISPLQFLKIIRQQTGRGYFDITKDYFSNYGIKPFYRGAYPYAKLNFYSSAAFGISEFFMVNLLKSFGLEVTIIGTFLRAIAAGTLETSMTVSSEVKEISRNKGEFMKQKGTVRSIIEAIFIRNTLFWMGSLISFYFMNKMQLSNFMGGIVSFIFGAIFAIITIPVDIVATHNCGDDTKHSIFSRLKKIIVEDGSYKAAYRGSLMRIVQITIFTITTVITEMILR
jgi:branched-subunit amino acid transport protein